MKKAEIVSLNVGKPKEVQFNNKEVSTAIYKNPVAEPIFLSKLMFDGDGQADLVHHGGVEKAVCVYAAEHYALWEEELQEELTHSAFGENLTTRGLLESDVCIGDVFQLGEALIQVTQPRQPCYKLTVRYGRPDLLLKMQQLGNTGFYCRVLKEGIVSPDDDLIRVEAHPESISIAFANEIMHRDQDNIEGMEKILQVKELSPNWRKRFTNRLEGDKGDSTERLTGMK